jgi:hypothetical protein
MEEKKNQKIPLLDSIVKKLFYLPEWKSAHISERRKRRGG